MFTDKHIGCGSEARSNYCDSGPYLCGEGHTFFVCPYCTTQYPSHRSLDQCCLIDD